jgi:hypothetical protein
MWRTEMSEPGATAFIGTLAPKLAAFAAVIIGCAPAAAAKKSRENNTRTIPG